MATDLASSVRRWVGRASEPVDASSLVFFRVAFGLLLFAATVRFAAHGWIREHYLEPRYFFPFWGLDFAKPLPGPWMYVVFAVMGASALGVAFGAAYRASALTLGLSFTYVHAIDKTYYLNHYYLVSVLAVLCVLLPLHRAGSVDAWRRGAPFATAELPAWVLWLLRFQIGIVYFFGGVAKLGVDWLVHAQPLTIWLSRNRDVFLIGPLLGYKTTAYAMSWAGLLFDLSTPFLLSWRWSPRASFSWACFRISCRPSRSFFFRLRSFTGFSVDGCHQTPGSPKQRCASRAGSCRGRSSSSCSHCARCSTQAARCGRKRAIASPGT